MEEMVITGGERLRGDVPVSGAKNAALPLLAGMLLAPGVNELGNVPDLLDIRTMLKLLTLLGAPASFAHGQAVVDASRIANPVAPYELVKTMRASILVLGPLLTRYGEAKVSLPGGCAIGARPVNLHLSALQAMGAEIDITHGYVEAKAKKLKGATIAFEQVTVTGTENTMMAAVLASGTTVLHNAAREPEVCDLAGALCSMGARISGAGSAVITIEGVAELSPMKYRVIPDRIEAGTLLLTGAVTGGDVFIRGANADQLSAVLQRLAEAGAEIAVSGPGIRLRQKKRLRAVDVITTPYPGFPTDMQAQFMAAMTLAKGASTIVETIFENRFMHVLELQRMGADIHIDGRTAVVRGVKKLTGAQVMATDLRASASLVLAGLAAEGATVVSRIYHLKRGYERLDRKLKDLGARIRLRQAPPPKTVTLRPEN